MQAQTSKAQVIGLANGGDDTVNAIKQAAEFGITRGGQKLAGLVIVISIVHGLGLETASGLVFTESFYWDMNEATRAWSKRFFARAGRMPGMVQAGTYSSVMHYLKSMQAAGTSEGAAVAAQMHALPVDDFFAKGRVREDGRLLHDFFLAEVKAPSEFDCAVGLLQDSSHHPGAGGSPAARAIEVFARQALTPHATARYPVMPWRHLAGAAGCRPRRRLSRCSAIAAALSQVSAICKKFGAPDRCVRLWLNAGTSSANSRTLRPHDDTTAQFAHSGCELNVR